MAFRSVVVASFTLLISGAASAAPQIKPAEILDLKCAIDVLKSNRTIQSAEAYARDDHRSAIEFTFADSKGRKVIGQLMLVHVGETSFGVSIPHSQPEETGWEALEHVDAKALKSKCKIESAIDSLVPFPPPREQWQKISLSNE